VIAQTLFAKRLAELSDARDNETIVPVKRKPGLAEVIKSTSPPRNGKARSRQSGLSAPGYSSGVRPHSSVRVGGSARSRFRT
jgi:hypothetical protein